MRRRHGQVVVHIAVAAGSSAVARRDAHCARGHSLGTRTDVTYSVRRVDQASVGRRAQGDLLYWISQNIGICNSGDRHMVATEKSKIVHLLCGERLFRQRKSSVGRFHFRLDAIVLASVNFAN